MTPRRGGYARQSRRLLSDRVVRPQRPRVLASSDDIVVGAQPHPGIASEYRRRIRTARNRRVSLEAHTPAPGLGDAQEPVGRAVTTALALGRLVVMVMVVVMW